VLLHPYIPQRAEVLLDALGAPDLSMANARFGAAVPTQVQDLDPLFPKQQAPEAA
jgi:methionyl-tRNA synthetase